MKEANALQLARLKLSEKGETLWRNSVGQYTDTNGHVIRYGLCVGSSDLIGFRPVLITPEMAGIIIAQFVAREVKGTGGRVSPAQRNFIEVVNRAGGDAKIIAPQDL